MIDANRINEIFLDCLFQSEEEAQEAQKQNNFILAEGIMHKIGFNPEKIKYHENEIYSILNELPDQFKKESGGGWSFLNACVDKSNNHWGEHQNIDQLFILGIAIKKVSYLMPREMWSVLPGGMPYVVII